MSVLEVVSPSFLFYLPGNLQLVEANILKAEDTGPDELLGSLTQPQGVGWSVLQSHPECLQSIYQWEASIRYIDQWKENWVLGVLTYAQLRFERHPSVHKSVLNVWGEWNHRRSFCPAFLSDIKQNHLIFLLIHICSPHSYLCTH